MDSLTHIAIGACIGELVAGKQLGKKAMAIGALAQSIPDIDIIASAWNTTAGDLLAHRGFTHSILFATLISWLLAIASGKVFRKVHISLGKWAFIWGIQLFMHLFLDISNVYGTGLFEPFSHYRVSLNTFFVLDPLFSIWPVIGLVLLIVLKKNSHIRKRIVITVLSLSAVYMGCSIANKLHIDNKVEESFADQHINASRYFTTPTALNNLLWYVVAQTDSGYYVGYRSVMDKQRETVYSFVPQSKSLLSTATDTTELAKLKRFSQGYYVVRQYNDTLMFNDLRFGEMTAGLLPNPRFCFYYYLQPNLSNEVIIQRGRFVGWDKNVVERFAKRMWGE